MNDKADHSPTGTQACAACKYQRRKCAPNCPLSPFFPPHRSKDFLNAHKLFGVGNMLKTIKNLSPQQKQVAMETIIFESNARDNDPIMGCCRIIHMLQRQYAYYKAEYELVLRQLAAQMARPTIFQEQSNRDIYNPSHFQIQPQIQPQQQGNIVTDTYNSLQHVYRMHSVNNQASMSSFSSSEQHALADLSEDIKPLLIFDENDTVGFDVKESSQCR